MNPKAKAAIRYGAEVRIYDNGGKSADRFTLLPPRYAGKEWQGYPGEWEGIACNAYPFDPQGIGMHIQCHAGSHLGKRIAWAALPPDVQQFARQTFPEWCPAKE